MGIVRENHPAKTQRVNEIEIIERWVAKTKKRINRLKTTVHGKQRKVPKTILKIICTPMEGGYNKLTNQNRDQTIVNVYKNNSDDTLSLCSLSSWTSSVLLLLFFVFFGKRVSNTFRTNDPNSLTWGSSKSV